MGTFSRRITETVPSLFRRIFSERNSVPNPNRYAPLSLVAAVGLFIKILANFPDFRVVVNNDKQGLGPTLFLASVNKTESLYCGSLLK